MRRLAAVALTLLCSGNVFGQAAPATAAVETLPAWTPGNLDIHQISTGRGNAAFFRFPDGTTMLVDAGAAAGSEPLADTDPRPDSSASPGRWIARYITTVGGAQRLDYAVMTHFHADHIGQVTPSAPKASDGEFVLTGITEVGEIIPIGTLIDRGDDYLPPDASDPTLANYRAFVAHAATAHGLARQKIRVGSASQIVLRNDAAAYPTFEVRNVAANGDVWTGVSDTTRHIFPAVDSVPELDKPTENMCSIGLRIRYGKFDYFTGGDMPGVPDAGAPPWHSVERAVAAAIGPTDVHVVNHHGSIDTESVEFLSALQSSVMILPAWSPTHPSQDVLKRILSPRLYPGPHDVFVTTLRTPTRISIGSRVRQLKATHGHVVLRVAPGGNTYTVYVLDDEHAEAKVLSVAGPYLAK